MNNDVAPKLLARNVAAIRRFAKQSDVTSTVAGNPVSTRLESGIGNCFPGLECDLRNLERRFLPFTEIDVYWETNELQLVSLDQSGWEKALTSGALGAVDAQAYRDLNQLFGGGSKIVVTMLEGNFGILGQMKFDPRTLSIPSTGAGRKPTDCWTAIRMLTENSPISVTFSASGTTGTVTINSKRAQYLDDTGALSAAFLPGELTQSLCSPWTHDFRDCGCFYWASNHPDIVQPVYPASLPSNLVPWNAAVPWQRRVRAAQAVPPAPAVDGPADELDHYEINGRWQELHFVVGRREIATPYAPKTVNGTPLRDLDELLTHLQYAAGVELGVAHEYLAAAYSLKVDTDSSLSTPASLRDDVRATRSELMRIAIGEMRHTRAVNDVLRGLMSPGTFKPSLRVASKLPSSPNVYRPVEPRVAGKSTIDDFITIEAPSAGVDGIYANILATLKNPPPTVAVVANVELAESISSIIAEGEDHFQTFCDIKEWLSKYPEDAYIRNVGAKVAPVGQAEHDALQAAYFLLLDKLFVGYAKGRLAGAPEINMARQSMLGIGGIDPLAHALADKGFIVSFDAIADNRFVAIDPPAWPQA